MKSVELCTQFRDSGETSNTGASVAVVGMACRFPGAANADAFWELLSSGKSAVTEVPPGRWRWQEYFGDPRADASKTNSKWGGFVDAIDRFDPLFFRLSPKEAQYIDPQQRLCLETAWHAIEDAGYSADELSGKSVGVYIGVSKNDYAELMRTHNVPVASYVSTGTVHSIIANRISYFLNLRGRSEVVDTACSSALVALHSAIRDLRSGEAEAALVGGVNALLSPTMYLSHGQSGMLSSTGKCATFDHRADGYVRAEGVGFILLKPLAIARHCGDRILGVIRGSAVNHGGRANTLTSPSVSPQAEVIGAAHRDAGISADTIDYIEAHGTGTPLGDPIEIEALKKAFSDSKRPRGLGSVKTNIGHLESASGMAALIKVLLSLRHCTLPRQLHFERLNPHIELGDSGLYVVSEKTEWPQDTPAPRRAGLSAFGMGGVNAHIVVEEAPNDDGHGDLAEASAAATYSSVALPLSARTAEALQQKAHQLAEYFSTAAGAAADLPGGDGQPVVLANIAFTLQTGRQAMKERAVVVCRPLSMPVATADWCTTLAQAFLALARGEQPDDDAVTFHRGSAIRQHGATLEARETDIAAAATAWVVGRHVRWPILSGARRIFLPLYPFERRRCWFELPGSERTCSAAPTTTALEVSSADALSTDHVVRGQPIMPGVGYLSIAQFLHPVVEQAEAPVAPRSYVDLYWLKRLPLAAGAKLSFKWQKQSSGEFSLVVGGTAHMNGRIEQGVERGPSVDLNVAAARGRCTTTVEAAQLYQNFAAAGLRYGPSFRVIDGFSWSSDTGEALVELSIKPAAGVSSSLPTPPALLDGVMQAVAATQILGSPQSAQTVPYHLRRATFYDSLPQRCVAHVKRNADSTFTMGLYTSGGKVLAVFEGLSRRPLNAPSTAPTPTLALPVHYYRSVWREAPLTMHREAPAAVLVVGLALPAPEEIRRTVCEAVGPTRVVVARKRGEADGVPLAGESCVSPKDMLKPAGWTDLLAELERRGVVPDTVLFFPQQEGGGAAEDGAVVEPYLKSGVLAILALVKAFLHRRVNYDVRLLYVYRDDGDSAACFHHMVGGLARTLAYEHPHLRLQLVAADAAAAKRSGLLALGAHEAAHHTDAPLAQTHYTRDSRRVRVVDSIDGRGRRALESLAASQPRTQGEPSGLYLITGGAGVLGGVFAKHLARTKSARVVLVGRSEQPAGLQNLLHEIHSAGGSGSYVAADLSRPEDVARLFENIERERGPLRGIVHAAGCIDDAFLLQKDVGVFRDTLRPKVDAITYLDEASAAYPLDFFIAFSSVAALMPNQGQADYAVGNSYIDAFCEHRNTLVANGGRCGRTLAINWPLWAEGGIRVSAAEEVHLRTAFGMQSMSEEVGRRSFECMLALISGAEADATPSHLLPIQGDQEQVRRSLGVADRAETLPLPPPLHEAAAHVGVLGAQQWEQWLWAAAPAGDGEAAADSSFDEIGFDSLALVKLVASLNHNFGLELRPSIFFEYQNIPALAHYLVTLKAGTPATAPGGGGYFAPTRALVDRRVGPLEFRKTLTNSEFFQRDHVVDGQFNVPGACFIEAAVQAFAANHPNHGGFRLRNNYWLRKLSSASAAETIDMRIRFKPSQASAVEYEISDGSTGLTHAMGLIEGLSKLPAPLHPSAPTLEALKAAAEHRRSADELYPQIIAEGLHIGPTFMPMLEVFHGQGTALSHLKLPESIERTWADYYLHPTLLTGVLQTALLNNKPGGADGSRYIPIGVDELTVTQPLPVECYVYCRARAHSNSDIRKFDATVLTVSGAPVATIDGLALRCLSGARATPRAVDAVAPPPTETVGNDRAQAYLIELCAQGIGLAAEEIGAEVDFGELGIDSIMVVELNRLMEKQFGPLSKTLLFEHRNFRELAEYFVEHHAAVMGKLLPVSAAEQTLGSDTAPVAAAAGPDAGSRLRRHVAGGKQALDAIAIVGCAGRYPKANCLDHFWRNLLASRDCIEELPVARFGGRSVPARWGAFLDDVDRFDALFFGVSPKQADLLDPQERLFLEVVWETLEHAGYSQERLAQASRQVGVFVGALWQPYVELGVEQSERGEPVAPTGLLYNIPNRVSYFFDWTGPSLAIDTACSSSLTALHYACQSLRSGECQYAIAGGVNLSLSAAKYRFLDANGFLSSDGRCRSFGAGGDGYVPGEGVGAVLLKRLQDAEDVGDRILGVIRATTVNHGGRTHGFTVPSPKQQGALIAEALKQAQVHPSEVSYVEAHGTGTSLGDPIEISGLTRGFAEASRVLNQAPSPLSPDRCRIGSLKSNIGHLEAAAGIAGLTKVLLQLEHQTLVPSLHSATLNPNINFSGTPFSVQRVVEPWEPEESVPSSAPSGLQATSRRIALLSSFGAGGSNGHMVIEEYEAGEVSQGGPQHGVLKRIFPLSAKDPQALARMCERLADRLAEHDNQARPLQPSDVAFTLQCGRTTFSERVAFVAHDLAELQSKLRAHTVAPSPPSGAPREQERPAQQWLADGNAEALAGSFEAGNAVPWRSLWRSDHPRLVSLPSYPFRRTRHWFRTAPGVARVGTKSALAADHTSLGHPLLHENLSSLHACRFASAFAADSFFVQGHRIHGIAVVPAAAQMGMVLPAAQSALAHGRKVAATTPSYRLEDIVLSVALTGDDTQAVVRADLQFTEHERGAHFVLRNGAGETCSTGLVLNDGEASPAGLEPPDFLRLSGTAGKDLDAQEFYRPLQAAGLELAKGMRAITRARRVDAGMLAWLECPAEKDAPGFAVQEEPPGARGAVGVLHPGVFDAIFQLTGHLCAPTAGEQGAGSGLMIPFEVGRLHCYGELPQQGFAFVRERHAGKPIAGVRSFDAWLVDTEGALSLSLQQICLRHSAPAGVRTEASVVTAEAIWRTAELPVGPETSPSPVQPALVLDFVGVPVAGDMAWAAWRAMPSPPQTALRDEAVLQFVLRVADALRAHLTRGPAVYVLAVVAENDDCIAGAIGGLLRTIALEFSGFRWTLLRLGPDEEASAVEFVRRELVRLSGDGTSVPSGSATRPEHEVRIAAGVRCVRQWKVLPDGGCHGATCFRDGGLYWITGGLGGVGRQIALALAERHRGVRLVLSGRSPLDSSGTEFLRQLNRTAAEVTYLQSDISSIEQTEKVVSTINSRHGRLHGVVHAAAVLRDRLFNGKTDDDWAAVLAAKVGGVVALDLATADLDLELFVCFTSMAGVAGNIGQCDYAFANGFVDGFCAQRHEQVRQGKRSGRSWALAWPLWQETGLGAAHLDAAQLKRLNDHLGIQPMPADLGCQAFLDCLSQPESEGCARESAVRLIAYGSRAQIDARLAVDFAAQPPKAAHPSNQLVAAEGTQLDDAIEAEPVEQMRSSLVDSALGALRESLADITDMPEAEIPLDKAMHEFGVESIALARFAEQLNDRFALNLTPTLFFEHTSLRAVADHLVATHTTTLATALRSASESGSAEATSPHGPRAAADAPKKEDPPPESARQVGQVAVDRHTRMADGPTERGVAIVGMAGELPNSPDLETFWHNLNEGKDCIREVPAERWDWRQFVAADNGKPCGSRWGGFIDNVDTFDAAFFNIAPREAQLMDPQQRKWLQIVWRCLEDAGYSAGALSGSNTALFVGVANYDYGVRLARSGAEVAGQTATGNTYSILANRVSFLLDLRGPSEPIDTACSSSLVAVHRGVQAILHDGCEGAIVGGVNALLTPTFFSAFSRAGMLSPEGRCKTFAQEANGYVRSEGCGAVYLKPLRAAERDGDHIYAVIRGTHVNHNGRAQSLTAPSPRAQTELLLQAYRQADIDPRSVGYIEAHGTGTALGDPIEIQGLKDAFAQLYHERKLPPAKTPHCGLGSVKSTIGHLESGAGIAGLLKVLLALRHKTLPPTLHITQENRYIDLEGTPFRLVTASEVWSPPESTRRAAGVSSFGYGGVNAHVVVEEYEPPLPQAAAPAAGPVCIVLSAKTEPALRQRCVLLATALESLHEADLEAVAYTLQVGRQEMAHRAAFLVPDVDLGGFRPLILALHSFSRGDVGEIGLACSSGVVSAAEEGLGTLDEGDATLLMQRWLKAGRWQRLMAAWVAGMPVRWEQHYQGRKLRRLALPSYPFAERRFPLPPWHPDPTSVNSPSPNSQSASRPGSPSRTTVDSGAYLVNEHRLHGRPILAGVACLDLFSRVARPGGGGPCAFGQVRWCKPLPVPAERAEVMVSEVAGGAQLLSLQLHGFEYAVALVGEQAPVDKRFDLNILKHQCRNPVSVAGLYQALEEGGLSYGNSYRSMRQAWRSDDGNELLVRLQSELPVGCVDGALQAAAAFFDGQRGFLPADAAQVLWHEPICSGWAHLRRKQEVPDVDSVTTPGPESGSSLLFDVRLLDDHGVQRVAFLDLAVRASSEQPPEPLWHADRVWVARELGRLSAPGDGGAGADALLLLTPALQQLTGLTASPAGGELGVLGERSAEAQGGADDLGRRCIDCFFSVLKVLRAKRKVLICATQEDVLVLAPVAGLLRSARLEEPELAARLVVLEAAAEVDRALLLEILEAEQRSLAAGSAITEVRYRGGVRHVPSFIGQSTSQLAVGELYGAGVYWLVGGLGGLGQGFAAHLATADGATVVVSGRRDAADPAVQAALQQICNAGSDGGTLDVRYRQTDITSLRSVQETVRWIEAEVGVLRGVVHAAGCLNDGLMHNKRRADVEAVLAPKIQGTLLLDQATAKHNLDFMVLFSSVAASSGNIGQTDYAAANAFLDGFAAHRNTLVREGARAGTTISIAWPLFAAGGMRAASRSPAAAREPMPGLIPISMTAGLRALDAALRHGHEHQIVAARPILGQAEADESKPSNDAAGLNTQAQLGGSTAVSTAVLFSTAEELVTDVVSRVIGTPADQIDTSANLEGLGIDSVMQVEIVTHLEGTVGGLAKTLLFEHTSIAEIASYLTESRGKSIAALVLRSASVASEVPSRAGSTDNVVLELNASEPYVQDHRFDGEPVVLGLTHPALMAESFFQQGKEDVVAFEDLHYIEPIHAPPGLQQAALRLQVRVGQSTSGESFAVEYPHTTGWRETARARRCLAPQGLGAEDLPETRAGWKRVTELNEAYEAISGFALGPTYRVLDELSYDGDSSYARVRLRSRSLTHSTVDPRLLNGAYIALAPQLSRRFSVLRCIPSGIANLWFGRQAPTSCVVRTRLLHSDDQRIFFDADFFAQENGNSTRIASLRRAELRVLPGSTRRAQPVAVADVERPLVPPPAPPAISAQELAPHTDPADSPIAVIGMAGRFAGAPNLEEFWRQLEAGADLTGEIPRQRFDHRRWSDSPGDAAMYGRWGSFVDHVSEFDAAFFGVSPREARWMDPQLRLLLQTTYHAAEDAAVAPVMRGSNSGVFVGSCFRDYMGLIQERLAAPAGMPMNAYIGTGNSPATLANRVSFALDLRGPSQPFDTACSSSLFALHAAVHAIRRGECTLAFVAGVNLILSPFRHRYFSALRALSPTGRCHSFSDKADGYVPAEGVVVVVLKSYRQALADGDSVVGVIKGSAVGHGGYTPSLTAPSVKGEARVIHNAWRSAGLSPDSLDYIEAHGTGTPLGDPIEVRALQLAFGERLPRACVLGSAKAHLGHTEGAAGLTGLVKILLQMRHNCIPTMPSFASAETRENPELNLARCGLRINRANETWLRGSAPRRAALSSFGFSGAYAHVVVEDGPVPPAPQAAPPPGHGQVLLPLSAKTAASLQHYATTLAEFVEDQPQVCLGDLAYTLKVGRESFRYRSVVRAAGRHELLEALRHAADTLPQATPSTAAAESVSSTNDEEAAEHWLNGHDSAWRDLYVSGELARARMIRVPGYSFSRERYWLPEPVDAVVAEQCGEELTPSSGVAADGPRVARLVDLLTTHIAELTEQHLDRLGPDDDVGALGLDSIVIAELCAKLEPVLGAREPAIFFAARSIRDAATRLLERFPDAQVAPDDGHQLTEPAAARADVAPARGKRGSTANDHGTGIAIIGMAGRYPGADDLYDFAAALAQGRDCIQPIDDVCGERTAAGAKPRWGGFLSRPMDFDFGHFNMTYRDALIAHPEERLLLQETWRCFESAGLNPKQWVGARAGARVGVYVGASFHEYPYVVNEANQSKQATLPFSSQTFSYANRLSYFFNLGGPSITIDSACSSSLYAVLDACNAIRLGACEMAIVGGVNLNLHRAKYDFLEQHNFLADDGRCRAFAEGGSGYVPGEGVGVALLKGLDQAQVDGDNILAVVRGGAAGNDGRTLGFTVPNPEAQSDAVRRAHVDAGITADTVSCIECHGTGTSLGDPIEVAALTEVFGAATDSHQYCAVSSVKSNIGHLEAAAGISQLTKMVLQLMSKQLYPNVRHHQNLNPNIHFERTPFYVQERLSPWVQTEAESPRRAGISSFGAGGTNVHLVLEEAPPRRQVYDEAPLNYIVPLSAPSAEQLRDVVQRTAAALNGSALWSADNVPSMRDLAATLQQGRVAMGCRLAVVTDAGLPSLQGALEAFLSHRTHPSVVYGEAEIAASTRQGTWLPGTGPCVQELRRVAESWTLGQASHFATDSSALRIYLPGYAFRADEVSPTDGDPRQTLRPAGAAQDSGETTAAAPLDGRNEEPLALVRETLRTVLGALPSTYHDERAFADLGIDSIAGAQVQAALSQSYPSLDLLAFFEFDSSARLAHHLAGLNKGGEESASAALPPGPDMAASEDPAADASVPAEEQDGVGSIGQLKFGESVVPPAKYVLAYNRSTKSGPALRLENVVVGGHTLELMVCGDGPTVVLLPPFNSTGIIWIRQLRGLARLYRLIVPHYPGLGGSDWLEGLHDFSGLAEHLAGAVDVLVERGVVPHRKLHWVGWSLGGFIAQTLSARHPEYVDRLVLVSTTTVSWSSKEYTISGEEFAQRCAVEFRQNYRKLPTFLKQMPEIQALHKAGCLERFVVGTTDTRIIAAYFRMIARFRNSDTAAQVSARTLLISGGDDLLMPAKFARALCEKIPRAEYWEIPGGEHFLSLFEAKTINKMLGGWLRS